MPELLVSARVKCFHCGDFCDNKEIMIEKHVFCCEGCCMVYSLLREKGLTGYYDFEEPGGRAAVKPGRAGQFDFLGLASVESRLISFKSDEETHVTLEIPRIHCSSCLYLLENLPRINNAIRQCIVNFPQKKATLVFEHHRLPLRELVILLSRIGYEPRLSLENLTLKQSSPDRQLRLQLGVAAFCFGNIMLMSFPEYLGLNGSDEKLLIVFRWLSLILAIPVVTFSALPFLKSGWEGLRNRFLNIDAPIALAIIVTFGRSCFEIFTATGSGYLDSLSGIVFFMLIGRFLQRKTYEELSFDRDYKSYFPIAVTRVTPSGKEPVTLPEIKTGDTLLVYDNELIPVDGIVSRGSAMLDYGFVTGEAEAVPVETGQQVYAGGKVIGTAIEVMTMKPVDQSYLTSLWSRNSFKEKNITERSSFVHLISRYFTYIVFGVAAAGAVYWAIYDSDKVISVVTAVLIIACPCALLLSSTFTNAYILKIFGVNRFYLRSAQVIEDIANADHIAFDKTGTLTSISPDKIAYHGNPLSILQQHALTAVAGESAHPVCRAIVSEYPCNDKMKASSIQSFPGKGIRGEVAGLKVMVGNYEFVHGLSGRKHPTGTYVSFDGLTAGYFELKNRYRKPVSSVFSNLSARYGISIISGDNDRELTTLRELAGNKPTISFSLSPQDKLEYIRNLQAQKKRVIMIGDGLNDAGALMQSETGVAVTENRNNFTPASDAILDATGFVNLPAFFQLCKTNKRIVHASFVVSLLYNIVGLTLALKGMLVPVVAAMLMPASTISILLISYAATHLSAYRAGLKLS
ncbi:heavy metal translocating P-type ATPase [Flavitalea antarctica]